VPIRHQGKQPRIAESAYDAPNAVISGDVTVGEETSVLFGAVITADGGPVRIIVRYARALTRHRDGRMIDPGSFNS